MSTVWNKNRIKKATIAPLTAIYEAEAKTLQQKSIKLTHPNIFRFKAISVGDENGQAFLIPLDESSKETAEYILRAIKAYKGE